MTAKYIPDLANDGFDSFMVLRHICVGIVDGKKDDLADVPFKEEADHYLNEKLTGYHDRMTRAALLEIAFFPTFYRWFSSRFFKAFLAAVNDECDTTTISGYYEDITALLGSAVELDALTQAMQNAFFSIAHMEVYRQGAINAFIEALLHQDKESSKAMFSLILDRRY